MRISIDDQGKAFNRLSLNDRIALYNEASAHNMKLAGRWMVVAIAGLLIALAAQLVSVVAS